MSRCLLLALALCAALFAASLPGSAAADAPSAAATPKQSYFELLGVTQEEARDELKLKRAYRKLALVHHPDKASSEEERALKQSLFVRLANAYEVLGDARLRTRYEFLLKENIYEYDSTRNWDQFDSAHGFARKKTKAEKEAEFRFKEAAEMFKKAQEEAEEFALWTSLSIAGVIALLPAAYMYFNRASSQRAEAAKKKSASSELRANQQALLELQEEQERARKQQQEEEREYARQLRAEREAAAAEAGSDDEGEGEEAEGEWEVVEKRVSEDADGDAASGNDSDDEPRSKSAGVKLKCLLCKKSFKSQAKLSEHEASNAHKKAVREAERANKKKSRKEE